MSLADLNINVSVDARQATYSLRDINAEARSAMQGSGAAVAAFQRQMIDSTAVVNDAGSRMGANIAGASDVIQANSKKAADAIQSIGNAANDVSIDKGFGDRVSASIQASMGSSYQDAHEWVQKTQDMVSSAAKAMAVGLAIGAISATAAAVYGAYRVVKGTVGFATGLITGESYKSANIDALIAMNNQVKELQDLLSVSAVRAGALADAMSRLGVKQPDFTATYTDAQNAMLENTDELDRLGIKYTDANGKLLDTQTFLENVRSELDKYTEGYDRNAAATAIGVGSFERVNEALRVTQQEVDASSQRLQDYGLVIGPNTQTAVAQYQQAMRDFQNESRLTGEGFKRAIADNIMPALTDLAKFFREGWPTAVRVFRYTMAEITSLMYGIKTAADIVVDAVKGTFGVMFDLFEGAASAAERLLHGDFAGAARAFKDSWSDAKTTVGKTWDEMVADAEKNRDRMIMAWGFADSGVAAPAAPAPSGKQWQPPPKTDTTTVVARSRYQDYMDELDRMTEKLKTNEYASMRLKAEQLAAKEGITDLAEAYRKVDAIQQGDSVKAVQAYVESLRDQADAMRYDTSLLGAGALQTQIATARREKLLQAEQRINQARQQGKPLTDQAISQLRSEAQAAADAAEAELKHRDAISHSASFGADQAMRQYAENARDQAANAAQYVTNSFQLMEDAMLDFVKNGKLNLGNLFGYMAEEYIRQRIRMQIADALKPGSAGGGFGIFSALGALFSGDGGVASVASTAVAAYPLATGTNYVPVDGFLAELHQGEAVVPRQYNPAAGARDQSASIHIGQGQVINIGQGVSRAEVAAGMQQVQASTLSQVQRLVRTGRLAA